MSSRIHIPFSEIDMDNIKQVKKVVELFKKWITLNQGNCRIDVLVSDEFDKIIIIHNLFGTVKITDSWDYEKDMMQLLSFYCDTDENFSKVAEFWYEPLNEIIKIKR